MLSVGANKKPMKDFRRTKLPIFRVGAENFVRRKIFCPPKFCLIRCIVHCCFTTSLPVCQPYQMCERCVDLCVSSRSALVICKTKIYRTNSDSLGDTLRDILPGNLKTISEGLYWYKLLWIETFAKVYPMVIDARNKFPLLVGGVDYYV